MTERYRSNKYKEEHQDQPEIAATTTPSRMQTYQKRSRQKKQKEKQEQSDSSDGRSTTRRVENKSPALVRVLMFTFVVLVAITVFIAIQ